MKLSKTQNRQLIDCLLIAAHRGREIRKQKSANESSNFGQGKDSLATEKRQNAQKLAQNDDDSIINHRQFGGGES